MREYPIIPKQYHHRDKYQFRSIPMGKEPKVYKNVEYQAVCSSASQFGRRNNVRLIVRVNDRDEILVYKRKRQVKK